MKHRYFSVIILASVAFIISLGLILVTMYNYFSEVQWKQLRRATEISAMAVINQGEDFRWNLPDEQYRTTLISPQGEVIFDTEKRDSHLENHLKRKEVLYLCGKNCYSNPAGETNDNGVRNEFNNRAQTEDAQ